MTALRHYLLGAAATAALLAGGPALAQGSGIQVLIEQAGFWRSQGQPARAVAALERALTVQPMHPEALAAAALTQIELGEASAAVPYLDRLRQAAPGDPRIARVEAALRQAPGRADPADSTERAAGEAALQAGDTARAVQAFEAALARRPEDRAALGGLGIARLREGRAGEARDLLMRASAGDPAQAARWGAALDQAGFATEIVEARRQMALGATEAAERVLLRASRRDVADRAEAELMLGAIALQRGELNEAEARFRAAVFQRPGLPAARQGLLESLRGQNRIAEADALARLLAARDNARAEALRAEASRTEDPESALGLLRGALAAAPASAGARLDVARQLLRLGRGAEGRALMQEALAGTPGPEAIQAAALFAQDEGRFAEGIRLLERVPDRVRGSDHARLLRSLRWQAEVADAAAQPQPGMRGALLALAGRTDPTGETAIRALRALIRAGDRDGATDAVRAALGVDRGGSAALRISLAGALSDGGMEREAGEVLAPLLAAADLAPAQHRQLAALGVVPMPQHAAAAAALLPIEAEPPRLYQGARDPRVAGRIAEAVLRRDPRNVEARMGAVEAALVQRDLMAAEALLAEGRLLNASDPRVSVMEARLARASGDGRRAQTALQLAADQRRAQLGAVSPVASVEAPYRRTMLAGEGPAGGFMDVGSSPTSAAMGGVTPSQLRASDDPLLSEIGRQLAEVNQEASGRVVPNFAFRTRSGERGLERLREYGGGVEAALPLPTIGGELSARVNTVNINTGRLDSGPADLRRFGTSAVNIPSTGGTLTGDQIAALTPRDRSATGTSLGIGYARGAVTVDLGSTPLGFREQTVLGGVEVTPRLGENLQLRLRGERRSVTDSLLAWSGMRDPRTGTVFGGVVRNTGRAQLEYYDGRVGAYAGVGYSTIGGRNVADNNRIEAGAGVNYAVLRNENRELVTGLDLTYFSYDKNLRLFTFGHGGYFSPQEYIAASIPVDYRERRGNFAYRLGASIGVAHFREKRMPYFPTNGALQAVAESQAAADSSVSAFYPSQRETSVTAGLRGDIEYALTPSLRLGASVRYDRSADFDETRALVYARYRFDP
ncbi:BCSC C-terminal domain-containing protein [Roseomonas sp. SSH11]|uniref:BCSC C-terminal domain-containing protein n=1 Tax=Pararoseomonas baculiformis TaxID=2820812 RepID=A0ABS4AK16_9PROT|nr:cellulose biosynthesis protein BcsC [Pararoseomonas baculiformis]MBP0447375.1 BCSC C-terminal domain-containing protein [Pararoseomonas baculiformis]